MYRIKRSCKDSGLLTANNYDAIVCFNFAIDFFTASDDGKPSIKLSIWSATSMRGNSRYLIQLSFSDHRLNH